MMPDLKTVVRRINVIEDTLNILFPYMLWGVAIAVADGYFQKDALAMLSFFYFGLVLTEILLCAVEHLTSRKQTEFHVSPVVSLTFICLGHAYLSGLFPGYIAYIGSDLFQSTVQDQIAIAFNAMHYVFLVGALFFITVKIGLIDRAYIIEMKKPKGWHER